MVRLAGSIFRPRRPRHHCVYCVLLFLDVIQGICLWFAVRKERYLLYLFGYSCEACICVWHASQTSCGLILCGIPSKALLLFLTTLFSLQAHELDGAHNALALDRKSQRSLLKSTSTMFVLLQVAIAPLLFAQMTSQAFILSSLTSSVMLFRFCLQLVWWLMLYFVPLAPGFVAAGGVVNLFRKALSWKSSKNMVSAPGGGLAATQRVVEEV